MNERPSHLSQCALPVILVLLLLVGSLLPASPVHAQAESENSDQQSTAVVGAYGNLNEHHDGRFLLYRTGDRVTATFTTTRSPVHDWARQHAEPLFHVPSDYRPPIPVIRDVDGHHVLIDGTPDPAQPNPRQFQLKVDPDGSVRYVGNSDLEGVDYLAYTLETIWGITLPAHFAVLGEILTESWSRSGFASLPVVPYVAPKPTASDTHEGPSLTLALESATVPPLQTSQPLGEAKRLSEAAAAELLAKVPQLAVPTADRSPKLPITRRDPPPAGGLEVQAFQPRADEAPKLAEPGDLDVVRFTPSGPVDWVPRVHIVFSKPMVPLTSHAALAEHIPEVTVSPPLEGEWRWQGTQTLLFQLSEAPAGSTRYKVKVGPEIESLDNSTLENGFTGEFDTPRLRLKHTWPSQDKALLLEPYFVLQFNQSINIQKLLPFLSLKSGSRFVGFEVMSLDDAALPRQVQDVLAHAMPQRTLVLRPSAPLTPNTRYSLSIAPGAPSAEGPLPTLEMQRTEWRTYGPLKITSSGCGNGLCYEGDSFHVRFSNSLDTGSLVTGMVSIRPNVPDGEMHISPGGIRLTGDTAPDTAYTLRIAPGITDVYGQTLNSVQELTFQTGIHRTPETAGLHLPNFLEVIHPDDEGKYSIFTRDLGELEIRLYRVSPADWDKYLVARHGVWGASWGTTGPNSRRQFMPFTGGFLDRKPVLETTLPINNGPGSDIDETILDLNPFLVQGRGHLLLIIVIPEKLRNLYFCGHPYNIATWLQVTDVGLDVHTDGAMVLARASALVSGEPIADLDVQLPIKVASTPPVSTDTEGYASFSSFYQPEYYNYDYVGIVGQQDSDSAVLPVQGYHFRNRMYDAHRWHVFSDRYLYQPGEEVRIKGWVREVGFSPVGDVSWAEPGLKHIFYRVHDARGVSLDGGMTELQPHGALDFRFHVPADANSGLGEIRLLLHDCDDCAQYGDYNHENIQGLWWHSRDQIETVHFRIEEFRRPEFEVSLSVGEGHHLIQEPVSLATQAKYYGGGVLEGAPINWKVSGRPAHYVPPGWHDFAFGDSVPWWWWWHSSNDDAVEEQMLSAELDVQGRHRAALTAVSERETSIPYVLQVQATVQDLSQQTLSASTNVLVHPAQWYVGGKTPSNVGKAGMPFALDLVVTDLDGSPVAGQDIRVTTQQVYGTGADSERNTDSPECQLRSTSEPVSCDLVFAAGGLWRIEMSIEDATGRKSSTRLIRWIVGGDRSISSRGMGSPRGLEDTVVTLIPDKDSYKPGDVAQIQIQSPIVPAHGTVILNRSGIVRHESIHIQSASQVLTIPIEDSHVPNLHVSVFLTGALESLSSEGLVVTNQAEGHINISIPTSARELGVDLQVATPVVAPGGEASVSVRIIDPSGRPVSGAEVVLMAVDEAVLALAGYRHAHPLESFYPLRHKFLYHSSLYSYLQSKDFYMPWHGCRGGGGDGGMEEALAELFPVRSDFNPLAFFEPAGETDESGVYRAAWSVPDTIGRYRVVAMASSGARLFGLSESSYTVRLPVSLRPQWPRFLNFDDQADFSVLVENQTDEEQELTLIAQSDSLGLSYQTADRTFDALAINLPARSRRQILVPTYAMESGDGQMLVTVFNERFNDSVLGVLPVYIPAAQEGFAAYGTAEELPVMQGLDLPTGVHQEFGQLTVTTSSTLLQSLLDSFLALRRHDREYLHPEFLASRILANLALRDVLYAFQLPGLPAPDRLDRDIRADIKDLLKLQGSSGGWPIWRTGTIWPFVSVHAMHALAVAQVDGYHVDDGKLQRGLGYLQSIERHSLRYSPFARRYITAYALYVRSLLDDVDAERAARLLDQLPHQTSELDVIAWSLLVLQADGTMQDIVDKWYRHVLNRADETTGKVVFARHAYQDDGHLILHSDRRSDALLLRMLMTVRPDADLIPKVVRSLMAARNRYGHWGSSQENLFVMQAMNQYFHAYEATTPDFLARVWMDDTLVMDVPFKGRETELRQVSLPMNWLYAEDPSRIHLQREGEGRLYYRLGFDYVPDDLSIDALERGFTVQRVYSGLDDPEDVWLDAEGRWHVKLGARVQINVTVTAPGTRHHVKLVSPLPAGLEFLNPALKGTESFEDPNSRGWYYWPWFDHQQLLDERAQVVTTWLWGGVYQYGAVARATTAGTFHVPPARVEEIYAPETFGNGSSEILIVEPT